MRGAERQAPPDGRPDGLRLGRSVATLRGLGGSSHHVRPVSRLFAIFSILAPVSKYPMSIHSSSAQRSRTMVAVLTAALRVLEVEKFEERLAALEALAGHGWNGRAA